MAAYRRTEMLFRISIVEARVARHESGVLVVGGTDNQGIPDSPNAHGFPRRLFARNCHVVSRGMC